MATIIKGAYDRPEKYISKKKTRHKKSRKSIRKKKPKRKTKRN